MALAKNNQIEKLDHQSNHGIFKSLSLTQRVMSLVCLCMILVGVVAVWVVKEQHKQTIWEQTNQQALIFLHGLERELLADQESMHPADADRILKTAYSHSKSELSFSVIGLNLRSVKNDVLGHALDIKVENSDIPKIVHDRHSDMKTEHLTRLRTENVEFLGGEINVFKASEGEGKKTTAVLSIPIKNQGVTVSVLSAELDLVRTTEMIEEADSSFIFGLGVTFATGIMISLIFIAVVIRRNLISPIREITAVATGIAEGDLTKRVETECCWELGNLSFSINTMADSIEKLLVEQEATYLKSLTSLTRALEAKDSYTAKHSARVSRYSTMLGLSIGLSKDQLELLKKGALMHDLGKIGVPDQILNKPASLSEAEFLQMKSHPVMTATIMRPLNRFKEFAEIAAWHHERWDGHGYPDRLKGEEIPLLARIVAIADTWDAMTGDRVYRNGMPIEKALSIIDAEKDSGQWDPELIRHFISGVDREMKPIKP